MSYILLQCMSLISSASIFLMWAGIALFIVGFAYSIIKNTWTALKTNTEIKRLPLKDYGLGAVLIDVNSPLAFIAGLIRPKIYISKGLFNSLTRDEIKAVFLHELHHKKRKDPLRLFINSFIKDAFFYIPIVRYFSKLFHAIKERAADDMVVSVTGKPLELASAILKVSTNNKFMMAASIKGAGEIEDRVKRLIGEGANRIELPRFKGVAASLFMALFILFAPIAKGYGLDKECNDYKCKVTHHHKTGDICEPSSQDMDCNKHCYMKM